MELCLRREDGGEELRPLLLERALHVGGTPKDDLQVQGLQSAAVHVSWDGERAFVTCHASFTIGGVCVPPGVKRLFLPAEQLELNSGARLLLRNPGLHPPRAGDGTMVRAFLGGSDVIPAGLPTLTCLTGLD